MSDTKLNGRLCSAASFVRQRAVVADIGTDHAYLPIFLVSSGVAERAYASDINVGPLKKAEENVERAGLADRIECRLADGACGLSGLGITDYTVCGMGGELIADIISRAPHLSEKGVRLILQPMSKQAHLRAFLLGAGFSIIAEGYSSEAGKDYLCLLAEYVGDRHSISEPEAELPAKGAALYGREAMLRYYKTKIASLRRAANGKICGGDPSPAELSLLTSLEKLVEESEASLANTDSNWIEADIG